MYQIERAIEQPQLITPRIMHSLTILRWAFQHSSDGMLITDLQGIIKQVNPAFVAMFGYSEEESLGKRTGFLKSEYSTPEFYKEMWHSLRTTGEWKGELINRTKDGVDKPCFLTITPILTDEGEHIGYLGVEIDLTRQKQLENELAQQEKLAALGEAVATLVHEIRNPLNGIMMNVQMLAKARTQGEQWAADDDESLDLVQKEVARLQQLTKTALDFSRKYELSYERVVLSELLDEVQHILAADQKNSGAEVRLNIDHETNLLCDPDLLKQALINLVQNALDSVRMSDTRVVEIRARGEVDSPQHGSMNRVGETNAEGSVPEGVHHRTGVVIEVLDTGNGIPPDAHKKLFTPFFTTKEKGLGLGLATCVKIVRQHHGILTVESPLKEGDRPFKTKFAVHLPA